MSMVLVVGGVLVVISGAVAWAVDECLNINTTWKRVPFWKRLVHTVACFLGGAILLRIFWIVL